MNIKEKIKNRDERLRSIALDLFEKCKSENLTIWEFDRTIEILQEYVNHNATINDQQVP